MYTPKKFGSSRMVGLARARLLALEFASLTQNSKVYIRLLELPVQGGKHLPE